jgi:hypothetical protein
LGWGRAKDEEDGELDRLRCSQERLQQDLKAAAVLLDTALEMINRLSSDGAA